MLTIYKYPLQIADVQTVMVPEDAEPLSVQLQGDVLCLWMLVDPEAAALPRTIHIRGTGHPIEGVGEHGLIGDYVGTVQMAGGLLVWHVFDEGYR